MIRNPIDLVFALFHNYFVFLCQLFLTIFIIFSYIFTLYFTFYYVEYIRTYDTYIHDTYIRIIFIFILYFIVRNTRNTRNIISVINHESIGSRFRIRMTEQNLQTRLRKWMEYRTMHFQVNQCSRSVLQPQFLLSSWIPKSRVSSTRTSGLTFQIRPPSYPKTLLAPSPPFPLAVQT